ncbi:uncharacterized protein LOC130744831 [Lotus japonicus]|uniref:uncharacterized protein LOC130744831 n=1 Tax=Lotus japonicus TaxID=34305 RepID=UPI0025910327|nr:uncharacterized protein LOC130744831 [Lotus japonicus]
MEGTSSVSNPSTLDDPHLLVDDFFFSAFYDAEEEMFPISDEKYAQELQLQEALFSSALSSASRVINQVDDDEIVTMSRTLKGKQKETGESSQISQMYCTICMDAKPTEEMGVLEPHQCRSIIPEEVFDRWENVLCDNLVLVSQKFYCPFKDCSAMLVNDDEGEVVTSSECPHCNRLFCAQCKVPWHGGIDCNGFGNLKEGVVMNFDMAVDPHGLSLTMHVDLNKNCRMQVIWQSASEL